jgi:hypothetical protein
MLYKPRDLMEVTGKLHAPAALPSGRSPHMSVGLVVGEPPNLTARDEEESTPHHQAHSQSLSFMLSYRRPI